MSRSEVRSTRMSSGSGTPSRRRPSRPGGDESAGGSQSASGSGKRARKELDLQLDVFHNRAILAANGWEEVPEPWDAATAMHFVDFPHFDRLWPDSSHAQHCKSKNAKYASLTDVDVKWRFLCILRAISNESKWPKNEIPKAILSLMYAEHVLKKKVDWSTLKTHGSSYGGLGDKLTARKPVHILYIDVLK